MFASLYNLILKSCKSVDFIQNIIKEATVLNLYLSVDFQGIDKGLRPLKTWKYYRYHRKQWQSMHYP